MYGWGFLFYNHLFFYSSYIVGLHLKIMMNLKKQPQKQFKKKKPLLFFVTLGMGILILITAVFSRPSLPVKPSATKGRLVQTMPLKKRIIKVAVSGFGYVQPKHIWRASVETTNKIIYKNPRLEKGQQLPRGTIILKLDPQE